MPRLSTFFDKQPRIPYALPITCLAPPHKSRSAAWHAALCVSPSSTSQRPRRLGTTIVTTVGPNYLQTVSFADSEAIPRIAQPCTTTTPATLCGTYKYRVN